MNPVLFDMLGWAGAILFLAAYALVSSKKVDGDSWLYQGVNILAGFLLVLNTFHLRSYPSLALNTAWIGIGVVALGNKWRSKKGQ